MDHPTLTDSAILIVDDQPANIRLLERLLSQEGYTRVASTTDPSQVLSLFTSFRPDLILLDLHMPVLDGYALLEQLQTLIPFSEYLPILVLTADLTPQAKRRALSSGAKDFLTKPIDLGEATLRIRNLLETRSLHRQLQSQNELLEDQVLQRTLELTQANSQLQNEVAQRQQVEEKLAQSEQHFRALIENSYDAVSLLGPDGLIQYASPSTQRILGYLPAETVGINPAQMTHPDDLSTLLPLLADVLQKPGHTATAQYRFRHKDGTWRWLESSITNLLAEPSVASVVFNYRDISERKQAEDALHESSRRFAQMTENIQEVLWIFDNQQQKDIYLSPAYEKIWGRSIEDAYKNPEQTTQAIHPDDREILKAALIRQMRGERSEIEYRIVKPDGTIRWIYDRSFPIWDKNGVAFRTTGVAADITERKQAQIALRLSEEKYRGLMESLDSVVATVGYDGTFLYMNDKAAQQLGSKPELLVGKTMHQLFPAPVADTQLERIRLVFAQDHGVTRESISFVQGQPRWFRTTIQPIHDETGRVLYVLLNSTDIHDLKTAQQELVDLNRTLEERILERTTEVQDLYDNAPYGYHSLNEEGRFVRINQTELDWLGYNRQEILGRSFTDFLTPPGLLVFPGNFAKLRQGGILKDVELELIRKDGSILSVLISATVIRDKDGNFSMSRSMMFDNTELKKAQDALRQTSVELSAVNTALLKAVQLKDEFLANMSHELRTPLNAILGLTETMLEHVQGPLNPKQQRALTIVNTSGHHLLALINDILDLSKIEASMLTLDKGPVSVQSVCEASLQFINEMASKKDIKVSLTLDAAVKTIEADERRLRQILINLLSNALKFTPQGGQVGLECVGDSDKGFVRFTVSDTGIGIAPADISKLFRPFVQVDSSLSRHYEGSGLGLVLVLKMTELHGGSVSVESQPGQGSRFSVSLPWSRDAFALSILPQQSALPFVAPSPSDKSRLILVAEDNEDNLELVTEYLAATGFTTITARDGHEALALAQTEHPALILMDIQMPNLNGLDAIRLVRQLPDPQVALVPVVAVTALAMPGDRELCLEAGFTDYIAKPITLHHLTELIERLLSTVPAT